MLVADQPAGDKPRCLGGCRVASPASSVGYSELIGDSKKRVAAYRQPDPTYAPFQYILWDTVSIYPKRRLFVRSRKVSKPRDWYFKLSYRFEIWQALRQHYCRSAWQISERSDNSKYKSRGFETLRDLTERRLFGYWVTLSWRVPNFVMIVWLFSKLERLEFSAKFEFDRIWSIRCLVGQAPELADLFVRSREVSKPWPDNLIV